MSIDGRGSSLSRQAQNRIAALVSERDRLKERVAVLEVIAQANADDRDAYAERCAELEQLICRIDGTLTALRLKHEARDREEFTGESVSALDAVRECVAAFQKVTAEDAKKESVA